MKRNSTLNALGFLTLIVFLSACSPKQEPINISATPVDRPKLVLPNADPIQLRDVSWIVITKENYESKFEELEKNGNVVVLFALTKDGYENISLNLSDVRAYIEQQQLIIASYESYYIQSNDAISNANREILEINRQIENNR